MIDIAVAYNRYRFLGNQFLTWIWFLIENDPSVFQACDPEVNGLEVGNRMVLENRWSNGKEIITIKGDTVGLEEGLLSLKKGGIVTDINLIYKSGNLTWQFSLKGEGLNFSGLKLPETGSPEQAEDIDGVVLEKLYLYEKPFNFIDRLYQRFIKTRLSDQWPKIASQMKKWIR